MDKAYNVNLLPLDSAHTGGLKDQKISFCIGGKAMIYIDERISKGNLEIFCDMIEKTLVCIMHDAFAYTNSVYGIAGLNVDNTFFKISNKIDVRDYFDAEEDVVIFNIMKVEKDNIHSYIEGKKLIEVPINQHIKHIKVVNEHQ